MPPLTVALRALDNFASFSINNNTHRDSSLDFRHGSSLGLIVCGDIRVECGFLSGISSGSDLI